MNKPKIKVVEVTSVHPWFPHSSNWPRWLRKVEYLIRVHLFNQPKYLIDNWTIDDVVEIESQYGVNVEEELVNVLIEEIDKEIKERGSLTWNEFCIEDESRHTK